MKKFWCILLTLVLCFNCPIIAFADQPEVPNLDGVSHEEAVTLVENYNKAAEEYNKQVDKDYEKAVEEYDKANTYNQEAAAANAEEDKKVAEVEAYNKAEQERVDAINQERQSNYEKELGVYEDKLVKEEPTDTTPKYTTQTEGKTTLLYDNDNNLVLKTIAGNTAKDDIITYENIGTNENPEWSSKYDYNGDNNRYVNFSLISTIGYTTTGTDWDNDASKYSNKVFATIADKNDVTAKPLDFSDEGEGRNLINYKTANMGLELCDSIIRTITNNPISTYYNQSNRNEELGKTESHITFRDFPTNQEVFAALQSNGSVFYDPDTGKKIIGEDINSTDYNICWFSVKYQKNGWRVSGVLLKNGVLVAPTTPEYEVANLMEYVPQYKTLIDIIAPIKGNYLDLLPLPQINQPITIEITNPEPIITEDPTSEEVIVSQPESGTIKQQSVKTKVLESAAVGASTPQIVADNITPTYIGDQDDAVVATIRGVPTSETIEDQETPLASKPVTDTSVQHWALLNLIFMIVNILLLLIIPRKEKKKEYIDKQYRTNVLGIILAIAAVITFILTQNIYLPMIIVDQWTFLMGVFCIGGILNKIFGQYKVK